MEHAAELEKFRTVCRATVAMHAASVQSLWWPNGDLIVADLDNGRRTYFAYDARGSKRKFFDEAKLGSALGVDVTAEGVPFDGVWPMDADRALVQYSGHLHTIELSNYSVERLPSQEVEARKRGQIKVIEELAPSDAKSIESKSPDGARILSIEEGRPVIRQIASGQQIALFDNPCAPLKWAIGATRSVWSEDSSKVCAIATDNQDAPITPVTHYLEAEESVGSFAMHRVGDTPPRVQIGIFDLGRTRHILVDAEPSSHCMPHRFSPDGTTLFILETCIFGRYVQLRAIDTQTGGARTIVREARADGGMVNSFTDHTLIRFTTFLPMVGPGGNLPAKTFVLRDGRVIWISAESGLRQIYIFNPDGSARRQLTDGAFPIANLDAVDEDAGWVYFSAACESKRAYDSHLFRVSLNDGVVEQLSREPGVQEPSFSPDLSRIILRSSSITRPPKISLHQSDGGLLAELKDFKSEASAECSTQMPEAFRVLASDGETIHHGVLHKPPDFDPSAKYPVIELIYAGSFVSTIPRTYSSAAHMNQLLPALASAGYVVVRTDTRGTPGRSRAFQDYACEQGITQFEIEDHKRVLEKLAEERPWMDLSRVAITGASYGGFFSIQALLTEPDFYQAGYAMCPGEMFPHVTQGIMEPYLGPYKDNWARYQKTCNAPLVKNLTGSLRISLGTADVNTPMRMLMTLSQAFVEADKHVEMCVLPDRDHVFMRPGDVSMPQFIFDDVLLFFLRVHPPKKSSAADLSGRR